VYTCAARNPAGFDVANFTLTTSLRAVSLAGLSYDQIAGIILALIVLIIIILGVIVVLLIRMRQNAGMTTPRSEEHKNGTKMTNSNGDLLADATRVPAVNGVKQLTTTTNGSIMTIRGDPYLQMTLNNAVGGGVGNKGSDDKRNGTTSTVVTRTSSNGYINHVAEVSNAPYGGGYDSENDGGSANLYRGLWMPDEAGEYYPQ
jgi:hypothetical protein